jgi:CheY-like chemotaxis protein/PAS domain-containing protein
MQRSDTSHWKSSEVARLLALVESERRYYQDLFAALPVAVAVVSEDQTLAAINREFRVHFGLVHEDLSRVRVADLLPDPELEHTLSRLLSGEQREASLDIRVGPRRLRVGLRHTRGWQDSPESEVLMTVEELAGVADAGSLLPSVTGAVAWALDRESEQLRCLSPTAEQDFGFPPEAWLSLQDWAGARVHPDDREMFLAFHRRPDETWRGVIEYRLMATDASVRPCRDSVSADAVEILGLTIDRTDEVRASRKSRLKARMDAADKLSARLAHVSNNLLMIVGGYSAEIMDSLPAEDSRRRDLEEILNASNRLARLTAQLNPMPAQAAAAGAGRFDLATWAAHRTPSVEVSGKPAAVLIPAADLTELADSVRQAVGEGPVSIESWPDEGEAEMRFVFPGRTEAEAEGLLDPFAGPKIGSDPPFGPMKALRRIIEAGGTVWVEECGEGARLVVLLPAEAAAEQQAVPEALATILLAEDEDGLRALMAKALRRHGYEVLEAGAAEAALEVLEARRRAVDLLVTDLTLPGMGGGKLALEVRWLYPETPVVFVTGASEDADAAGLIQHQTNVTLLAKPFPVEELVREVDRILGRPRARGASAD